MCGNPFGALNQLARALDMTPQTSTPVRVVAPPQVTCVRCHARVDASYEWCPHCGASLRATPCAYCGRRVAAGLGSCPSCGAPIQVLSAA
jgi:predicted amidophosphoribosyltransferase